jgi:hypothetical protein
VVGYFRIGPGYFRVFAEKLLKLREPGVELPPGNAEPVRTNDCVQPGIEIIARAAAGIAQQHQ